MILDADTVAGVLNLMKQRGFEKRHLKEIKITFDFFKPPYEKKSLSVVYEAIDVQQA